MKKVLSLLLISIISLTALRAASKSVLEDTSLVRISEPGARAEFLNKIMREKLSLGEKEAAKVEEINAKYEEQLQETTLANPAGMFGVKGKQKKGTSPFDKLSEARDKEMKKALSSKQYKEYDTKQRWAIRNMLKKQMQADYDERMRIAREEEAKRKKEAEKARQDSIAAANKKAPVKPVTPAKNSKTSTKKPAKSPAKKPASKKKK